MKQNSIDLQFNEITQLINQSRQKALRAVNTALIDLYWQLGRYISEKIGSAEWGEGIVEDLAKYLAKTQPGLRGFTKDNLFRMRQFYDTYHQDTIVGALARQLTWTNNLIIFSKSKYPEEREFYLRMTIQEQWSKRELERQIKADLHKALLHKLKSFLTELGRDFCFIASEFPLQVGKRDVSLGL